MLLKEPVSVQMNMLKAWDFTKNKLCHRYFDNNLQTFSEQIFLRMKSDKLMVGSWLKLQMEIVIKMSPSLLVFYLHIFLFEF